MFFHVIEQLGGSCRFATLLTFVIHFLHPLFCVANFCNWVRLQQDDIGAPLVKAYLAMTVVACFFYLFSASVFYMWAWRFPEPEEVAKRRRIYGIFINLLFSDIPLFVIETKIVWAVQFANGLQGFTFCLTCVSIFYSVLRVWTFFMVKIIKVQRPVQPDAPPFRLARPYMDTSVPLPPSGVSPTGRSRFYDADYPMEERLGGGTGGNASPQRSGGGASELYGPSASRYYDDSRFTPIRTPNYR